MPATLLEYLAVSGARDSSGNAVSTGTVNFYQPGTLTPVAVYSDDAATLTISQPITLDAGGRTSVYTIAPVRAIIKDSTGATVLDLARVNGDRAELVWQTATGWTASSVKTALENLATSLGGADGKIRPTGGSADQNIKDWAGSWWINVKSRGAVGDGTTDDTAAIAGAISYLAAQSPAGGTVYFPPGTYAVSGLTIGTSGSGVNGITLKGANQRASTIKLTHASNSAVLVTDSADFTIEDLGFTHSTSTTGAAVRLTGTTYAHVNRIRVTEDDYAFGVDMKNGAGSSRFAYVTVSNSYIQTTTDSGSAGVRIGNASASVENFNIVIRDNHIGLAGYNGNAIRIEGTVYHIHISGNRLTSTGASIYVSAGAVGTAYDGFGITVVGNSFFDASGINIQATHSLHFQEYGNLYGPNADTSSTTTPTDLSMGAVWGSAQLARRPVGFTGTQATLVSGSSQTPDLSTGSVFVFDSAGGATINNPVNASAKTRGTMFLLLLKTTGVDPVNWSFGAQYKTGEPCSKPTGDPGTLTDTDQTLLGVAAGRTTFVWCVWDGSNWRLDIGTTTDN